jgi:signal transduction histidine kinase
LYGDRGDPYSALSHTTQVLSGSADPAGALRQAVDDLARRLRCPGARIVREGVVLVGPPGGVAGIAVPLIAGSVEVGRLEVLPRSPGEQFSRSDERLILDLCAPLTNAVAAVGLTEDLKSSRERLAVAREDERRRVRSELHDDIGPSLAAVAVQAQTALRRIERNDTSAAVTALRALQLTTTRASSDLRSVIDALGPRALDEVGLVEAVQELVTSLLGEKITTRLDFDRCLEIPAVVEVAVYRVIAEALTNAGRHASANAVVVAVKAGDSMLVVTVSDDGVGHPTLARPGGVGVPSMRARIEEVGGRLEFESGDEGTTVTARIPLIHHDAAAS